MKRALLVVALAVAALLGAAMFRTLTLHSYQTAMEPAPPLEADLSGAAARLAGAVRVPTVSRAEGPVAGDALQQLHRYLEESFPLVRSELSREVVADYSLLYRWPGRDSGQASLLLLGHLDVVPVAPGTEGAWTHPPFAGDIADGFIWGRGTMDDKLTVLGLLEAVEALLAEGFVPPRTVYLAFGHDEEVGGGEGAAAIAALLAERGVSPALILDEGMTIGDGLVPGLDAPIAFLGIAEKGYVDVELTAHAEGGHSSMPPRETAVGLLARALDRLQEHPMPSGLDGPAEEMFRRLAPEMSFVQRFALANLWLTAHAVKTQLAAAPATDSLLRTTTAPTVVRGGDKPNVLPPEARAVVNFRIHPRDSVTAVLAHVRRVIDDSRVEVAPLPGGTSEPSPVSPVDGPAYRLLDSAVRGVFPGVLVAPSLLPGATDSRHYRTLTPAVYRFCPMIMGPDDLTRVHGTDERLGVDNYHQIIRFYAQLLRSADQL